MSQKRETLKFTVYVGIAYEDEAERKACLKNARQVVMGFGETLGYGAAITTKTIRVK